MPRDGKCFIWSLAAATAGTCREEALTGIVAKMANAVEWCSTQTGITPQQKRYLCHQHRCHWVYLVDSTLPIYSERVHSTVLVLRLSPRGNHVDLYRRRGSPCCLYRLVDMEGYDIRVEFIPPVPAGTFVDLT